VRDRRETSVSNSSPSASCADAALRRQGGRTKVGHLLEDS
jgi:hypothetical protein